ncbi:MAG: elongation factor G [Clostridiales bacterium]|nr:elongation factor G [Clostridiales bacterium]
MNNYTTDQIRNVVLLGHGGAGKTSLVEAMAFLSGLTNRLGKVDDGTSLSDFDKEEQKRKFSISTSVVPVEWKGHKINLLDTPGYFDFVGEAEEAAGAADAAIIVVSAKAGVEVGTEKAWDLCEKFNLPRMFYVADMDIDNASYREVVETLTEKYGSRIAPLYQPIRENEKFVGYVNVIKQKGRRFIGLGKREEIPVPDYCVENMNTCREALIEAVAETSEEMMDRYFAGEEFSEGEIRSAVKQNVITGDMVPVEIGSSTNVNGIFNVLNDIIELFPSPLLCEIAGFNKKTNEVFEANYDFSIAKSAYVWKTIIDPFIGKYSLIKVCSGVLKGDSVLYNAERETEEKPGKLYVMQGNKPIEVSELQAGDIGAIAKLNVTLTGDTLSTKDAPIIYGKTEISKPYTYKRYQAKNKGEEDKVAQAIAKLAMEDLTLKSVVDAENRQSLIYGIGDQQLDVVVSKLASRYKAEIVLSTPRVAFRETIRKNSDIDEKYKKQSGGHGQYGHVKMRFEPSGDLEKPYIFEECVVGGSVPKNYFPAVEKGLQDSVVKGPVAGYPVVGVKATLYDGSYHPVDSSEMAFKTATVAAFKKGFLAASPVLLEPISSVKVTVPDSYTGDIMGDLNKRRGRVLGMTPVAGGLQIIEADVPAKEMFDYCTSLRSMTGGRGKYEYEFARYEQAPSDVQEAEIAARAAEEK